MRQLLEHLRAHLRDDWNPHHDATMLALRAATLAAVHGLDLEAEYIDHDHRDPLQIPSTWPSTRSPDPGARLPRRIPPPPVRPPRPPPVARRPRRLLRLRHFHYYTDWIDTNIDPRGRTFVFRCAANLLRTALGFSLVLGCWWLADRDRQPLHGLSSRGFRARPYLLLALVPRIAWASSQPDFLAT